MCVLKLKHNKSKTINRNNVGAALQTVLKQACVDQRLICGLLPAVARMEQTAEDVALCVVAITRPGDVVTHMQTVLLQAFCYENQIPVIQVESGDKLAKYCGSHVRDHCSCAIIMKEPSSGVALSSSEQALADFYEITLSEFPRPIIEFPG